MPEDAAGLAAKGQSSSISREQMIELPSPSQATAAGCDNCCRSGENRDTSRYSLRWAGIGSRLPGARILGPILGDFPAGLDAEKGPQRKCSVTYRDASPAPKPAENPVAFRGLATVSRNARNPRDRVVVDSVRGEPVSPE